MSLLQSQPDPPNSEGRTPSTLGLQDQVWEQAGPQTQGLRPPSHGLHQAGERQAQGQACTPAAVGANTEWVLPVAVFYK